MGASIQSGASQLVNLCGSVDGQHSNIQRRERTLANMHFVILYYIILYYYITLHYITLHYTTLHYTTLHYTTLHYTTHYTTLYYIIIILRYIRVDICYMCRVIPSLDMRTSTNKGSQKKINLACGLIFWCG